MRALAAVILNTFREAVRQPFYPLLVAAGAGALLATVRLPLFTFYNDTDMYKDLGLSFVLLFVLLAGLLAAATGVAREVEEKTAQTVLAKSIGRWQFVLGKYLGAMAAVALATAVLGLVFGAAMYYRVAMDAGVLERGAAAGGLGSEVAAFRARQWNQALTILPGMVLVLLQVGVLAAVATALSTRLSVGASVGLSLAAFVVGHLTVFLEAAVRTAGGVAAGLAQAVVTVVPFLEIFNINQKLSHAVLTPFDAGSAGAAQWAAVWVYVGWAAVYAAAYAAAALGAGVILFRRRSLA
jgi:ABC-type transport system involved in multi-copper enzyme maturation permease subunit